MKNPRLTEHIHELERLIAFPEEACRMFFYEALHYDQFFICNGCMRICRMAPGETLGRFPIHVWITDQSEYNKIKREAMAWNTYVYQEEYKQRMTTSSLHNRGQ